MSKFLGVWGGGPPGHYLDATPVEVKSGQNLVFPLKKGRVSLCGKRGLDLHRGRKFVSVRGGPHPTHPFFAPSAFFGRNPKALEGFFEARGVVLPRGRAVF